ncbi:MAG: hypothetical protein ACREUE_18995, partial [Panacagrimonas sp.]
PGTAPAGADWASSIILLLTTGERNRPFDRDSLIRFADYLASIEPPDRRYAYLHYFRWLPELRGLKDLLPRFNALVPIPSTEDVGYFAKIFGVVELQRCLDAKVARDTLRDAFAAVQPGIFVHDRLLEAAHRLRVFVQRTDEVLGRCKMIEEHPLSVATRIRLISALLDANDEQRADRVVSGMPTELPRGVKETQLEAEYLYNRSRLLRGRDRKAAEELALSATALWSALGRPSEAARVAPASGGRSVAAPRRKHHVVALKTISNPLPATSSREIVSFAQARALLEDPQRLTNTMREALQPPKGVSVIELGIDDATTAALPWEWAEGDHEVVFRSSAKLPWLGSSWDYAVWNKLPSRLRRAVGLVRSMRVGLVRPPVVYQERTRRGFELHSLRSLRAIYEDHGAQVFEPRLSVDGIAAMFHDLDLDLVHIQGAIVESRGKLTCDLPLEDHMAPSALGTDFWASQLRFPSGDRNPVILLDPPRASSEIDVAWQLLLRNQFAADLAATGKVRAILCVGLFER